MNWTIDSASSCIHLNGHIPAINDKYLAYTAGQSGHTIYVVDLAFPNNSYLQLIGHHKTVTALAFSFKQTPCWLVSCAQDHINLWNMDQSEAQFNQGDEITHIPLCKGLGSVEHISMSNDCTFVACCTGTLVAIISTQNSPEENPVAYLEGHTGVVVRAEFLSHSASGLDVTSSDDDWEMTLLVSLSEDRSFKVWRVDSNPVQLVYQSAILSPQGLTALAMHTDESLVAFGDLEGNIFIFDSNNSKGYRQLSKFNIAKTCSRSLPSSYEIQGQPKASSHGVLVSSRPTWQLSSVVRSSGDMPCEVRLAQSEASSVGILDLQYVGWWTDALSSKDKYQGGFAVSDLREALCSQVYLLVATYRQLMILNGKSFELEASVSYSDLDVTFDVGNVRFTSGFDDKIVLCLCNASNTSFTVLTLSLSAGESTEFRNVLDKITLVARTPLQPTSVLHAFMAPAHNSALDAKKSKQNSFLRPTPRNLSSNRRGSGTANGANQPVTFRTKIASSGYAKVEPKRQLFQPSVSTKKATDKQPKSCKLGMKKLSHSYPLTSDIPSSKLKQEPLDIYPVNITKMSFSGSGSSLACSLSNSSCQVLSPTTLQPRSSLIGHNARVTWTAWSNDSEWVMTSSADKTARVWQASSGEVAMAITHQRGTVKIESSGTKDNSTKDNPPHGEVCWSQFFYLDHFFYLVSGNEIFLYKYHLDITKSDIKRYQCNSKYKLVKSFSLDSCNRITALASVNTFYSYLIVRAGSDKSISLLDMNVGQTCLCFDEVHSRTVDCIALNQGSAYSSLPSEGYTIFASIATADGIKLWDMRSQKSIQRYQSHVNRSTPILMEFSPCGRYLACGSEDRAAYVYDIRATNVVTRLPGHSDTVTAVTFHPAKPGIFTGSVDGKVTVFGAV